MYSEILSPEVGVRITFLDFLQDPPGGSRIGDMGRIFFQVRRVQETDHATITREDERAWVTLGRERARILVSVILVVVVNG